MSFTSISSRVNGEKILYSWFEALKAAGVLLEGLVGTSFVTETSFTVANNQSAAANVTGLLFDHTLVRSAIIDIDVYRNTTSTGATELKEVRSFTASWKPVAAAWTLTDIGGGGDDSGVVLTITSAGQVKYTSTNITGTPATSVMKFKARTFAA